MFGGGFCFLVLWGCWLGLGGFGVDWWVLNVFNKSLSLLVDCLLFFVGECWVCCCWGDWIWCCCWGVCGGGGVLGSGSFKLGLIYNWWELVEGGGFWGSGKMVEFGLLFCVDVGDIILLWFLVFLVEGVDVGRRCGWIGVNIFLSVGCRMWGIGFFWIEDIKFFEDEEEGGGEEMGWICVLFEFGVFMLLVMLFCVFVVIFVFVFENFFRWLNYLDVSG